MKAETRLSILQVCSASRAVYGAVQSLMTLAASQREVGHRVEFLSFKGKAFGGQVAALGYPVHEVRVRWKIDPIAILRMRSVISAGKFDLVHTHLSTSSVTGCIAARLARVPCVATVHGMSGKLSFVAADHLIAVSTQVKQHLTAQGVSGARISVVHNGIDLNFRLWTREEARRSLGLADDDCVVGTVSRVTELKGIDDGIRAVARLAAEFPAEFSGLKYLVVGDGDGLEPARALACQLGLEHRVIFVGYQTEVGKFLPAMDVFLFPSKKEAMGIALVEAMMAGLPCVASNVDGIPEVVVPETGRLVPVGSPIECAEATAELLRNAPLRAEMGKNGRARALEFFSAEAMERATDWVYRGLIGGGVPLPAATARAVAGRMAARR